MFSIKLVKLETKDCSSFSDWFNVICGIPQGQILCTLLFNIFINDMLFFFSKLVISNFADDNPISSCGKVLGDILHKVKCDLVYILKWFKVNSLKPNPGNFQFMLSRANPDILVSIF